VIFWQGVEAEDEQRGSLATSVRMGLTIKTAISPD